MLLPTNLTLIALFSSPITNIRDDLSASHRAELEIGFKVSNTNLSGTIRRVSAMILIRLIESILTVNYSPGLTVSFHVQIEVKMMLKRMFEVKFE